MADQPHESGPGEPSPLPAGEFKSDFFEHMGRATTGAPGPETLAELPPPPVETPVGHPTFPIVIGLGFLALVVAAAVFSAMKSAPAPVTTAAAPGAGTAPAPGAETSAKEADLKALLEGLKAEIAGLAKEVKDLDGRFSSLPKPEPSPDLAPLNAQVAALSKSVDSVAPLSKKVESLDQRLGGLDGSLKSLQEGTSSLKDQVVALRGDLKKPAAAPDTDAATRDAAKPVTANAEGQSLAQAAELFKAGKYQDASKLLKTNTDSDSKDARVWYYAALSAGLASGQWLGDTQKLVMKGVEREKAGTPTTAEIDAEFAKLAPTVKPWLDTYRKLAQK